MPQPSFLFFWCVVALVLLLRLGGFEDIDELPTVLRPWFRVHPGYLDDFTFVCSKLRISGILSRVSAARPAALYADGARAWSKAALFLNIKCFHCVHQKKEYSVPITDQVVPRGLSKEAGTQTLDADWKSLKSWLPQNGSKKEGKGVKAKHSTKLEVRVWQWLFRREKFRGSCQENISALAKVWKRK